MEAVAFWFGPSADSALSSPVLDAWDVRLFGKPGLELFLVTSLAEFRVGLTAFNQIFVPGFCVFFPWAMAALALNVFKNTDGSRIRKASWMTPASCMTADTFSVEVLTARA